MTQQSPLQADSSLFKLEYPQSVAVFNTYADAQKAVDHLADNHFPIKNLAIVGTDLKLMERVTGRRTWGTVLGQGVMSGLSTGFIVAIFMMLLVPSENFLSQLLVALLIGVGIGLVFSVLGYGLTRGQRDFTSITQTVATKYEVLCEHKVVAQAREMLARAPGGLLGTASQAPATYAPATPAPGPQSYGGQQSYAYPPAQPYPAQGQGYPGQPQSYPAQSYPAQPWPGPQPQQPAQPSQPPQSYGQQPYGAPPAPGQGGYPPAAPAPTWGGGTPAQPDPATPGWSKPEPSPADQDGSAPTDPEDRPRNAPQA